MIELILTNTLDSAPILEKLKKSRGQTQKHLLFVPDRFSLSYQKAVLEYLNIKGTFDIEVTSFPRLANSLLKGSGRLLDKQSEIMLLRKVIDDNKSQLRCFARAGKSAQFANDMYAAISQIRNSNISVERMAEMADSLPGRLADKTKDIVTIYRGYVEFLQSGYIDGTSKLQALAELVSDGRFNDCNIYISDFMSFSSVEYDIIRALMANSMNTYISLVDGGEEENKQVYPYEVKSRLISLAQECGAGLKISNSVQPLDGDALIIHKGLYSYSNVSGDRDGRCEVVACADAAQEIKSVAREINSLVANGARYRDFAIVCCDLAAYSMHIKRVFDDFSIPFYADIKQPLFTQAVSKLLLGALRVRSEKFAAAQVCEYAKHPYVTADFEEACIFENYCLKYGIEYTRFFSPFLLGDGNDRIVAEKIRQRVVGSLAVFDEDEKSAAEHARIAREFLDLMNVGEKTEEFAERQHRDGLDEFSSVTMQSLRKIEGIIDQCENMLGGCKMSLEEFYAIISAAIESVEMSNIPLYSDCVFIGENSGSRYENIDYMFVIGATAGKFPAEHTDSGIVSERECSAWGKMGIDVQPDCRRRNTKERLNTLMTLTRARKRLRISYPSSGVGGEELQPSSSVRYILDLLGEKPRAAEIPDCSWSKSDYARYVSVEKNALHELLSLRAILEEGGLEDSDTVDGVSDALYAISCRIYGKQYVDALLGEEEPQDCIGDAGDIMFNGDRTSVSQFEKYFKCPFLHFNENVLKLKRRDVAGLEVKDTGIILHAVLEKYFSLADCADKGAGEIESAVSELFARAVAEEPDYANRLTEDSAEYRRLREHATYVVKNLVANMQKTKFRPAMLEAAFGADPKRHSLKGMQVNSGKRILNFEGVIDRIDCYKDRAIVIDYKSKYSIEFSPSNILYGDRIQLFVYLNALKRNNHITPQGVFYLLMNNRFVNGGKSGKRFIHRGFVNGDPENINDLDSGFASAGTYSSDIYPIKCKTDKHGERTFVKQSEGELLDAEGFEKTCDYVMRLTQKAAEEIEDGYIAKSPLNIGGDEVVKACKYCDYSSVCSRFEVKVRNVGAVGSEKFAQITGGGKCRE